MWINTARYWSLNKTSSSQFVQWLEKKVRSKKIVSEKSKYNLFMLSFSSIIKKYKAVLVRPISLFIQSFPVQRHHQGWENIPRALYVYAKKV